MTLAQRLLGREKLIGLQSFSGSPHIIDIIGQADFDVVMIDTEHTANDIESTTHLLRAASSSGLPAWVRIGVLEDWYIMKALDLGAEGVVVPRIRSAGDVERAIRASRYPPRGTRGMCPDTRASRYSMDGWMEYARDLDNRVSILPLIEDAEGMGKIGEIAAVEGIQALFFGPADFGVSIGAASEGFSPRIVKETRQALDAVVEAAGARGLSVISTPLVDLLEVERSLEDLLSSGVNVIMYSIDTFLLSALSRRIVGTFRSLSSNNS